MLHCSCAGSRASSLMAGANAAAAASPTFRSVGDHLSEPLTIKSLAQQYGVSESKLAGDFKSALGMTFKKYLTTLRMTRAREMLLAGESIIRTSLECGYSSEAHFVKSFREYWGTTPGEFIRQTKDSG